jgi:hypothetical protein
MAHPHALHTVLMQTALMWGDAQWPCTFEHAQEGRGRCAFVCDGT